MRISYYLIVPYLLWLFVDTPFHSGLYPSTLVPMMRNQIATKIINVMCGTYGRKHPWRVGLQLWEVRLGLRWSRWRVKMESLFRLSLGTIYITSLWNDWSLSEHVLGTQPYSTCSSASTYCVPNLNFIKRSSNRLFYTHTH